MTCNDPHVQNIVPWGANVAGVNSFVTRAIKKIVGTATENGKEVGIFVVGEKGRSQLSRAFPNVSVAQCLTSSWV